MSSIRESECFKPVIDGGNIDRYYLRPANEYVHFIPAAIKSGGSEKIYKQDRICIRQIGATPIATFVPSNIFTLNTVYNVYVKDNNTSNLKFLLGVVNSNIVKFFWIKNNSDEKKTFPKIKKDAILSIPVPVISRINNRQRDEIIRLVEKLLDLRAQMHMPNLQSKLDQIQGRINYCEQRINEILYELYDLTEEEIAIVEST